MRARSELAWAAGLFEGEGYIGSWVQTGRKNPSVQAILSSTDEDVVRHFAQVVGVGRVYGPYRYKNPKWKPYWQWQVQTFEKAQHVVCLIWPWLGVRRKGQAYDALSTYLKGRH